MSKPNYKKLLNEEKKMKRNGTHSFHRYFGKFIPAIPAFAIKTFTKEGDVVLDCFCGSGTTLVEAKYLNRDAYGIDINPLASFTAKVKTTKIDSKKIKKTLDKIISSFKKDRKKYKQNDDFYCVNIDHWFKDFAKEDLLKLRKHILDLPRGKERDFFLACFSAFLRSVSNADPRHVFPGYSKRLRKLDAEGKRNIKVIDSFERAVKKRFQYLDTLPKNKSKINILNGDSRKLPQKIKGVKLVVINPPYISSIRYLETMKIEMGWLNFINDQKHYLNLDKQIVGTERFYKNEIETVPKTEIHSLDRQLSEMFKKGENKMANVVSKYFIDMKKSIYEMYRVLKKDGHIVIKISDSEVRSFKIPTHKYLIQIAEELGMELVEKFKDDFDPNSRSLLTSRNSYSGIMNYDWIIILKK